MADEIKEYGPKEIAKMLVPMLRREGRKPTYHWDLTSKVMSFMDVESNQAEDVIELLEQQGYIFHSNCWGDKGSYVLSDKGRDLVRRYL